MEWGARNRAPNTLRLQCNPSYSMLVQIDSEYFHHPENFFNALESSVTKGCQVSSLTPCDTFHVDGQHISRGHHVPSLTPHNTLCLDGHHVSKGRQVPSQTPRDTFCPNDLHVSRGGQVPHSSPRTTQIVTPLN